MRAKKGKSFLGLFLCIVMVLCCIVSTNIPVKAENVNENKGENPERLIDEFVNKINDQDIQGYIDLFAPEISKEMKQYVNENGEDEFFVETRRDIISIEKINSECAVKEKEAYEDVAVFRVVENIKYKHKIKRDTCELKEGVNTDDFVIVKQNGNWYIYRVSAADVEQDNKAITSLTCPTSIKVYMTKDTNYNHYGVRTKSINFNTYLKNVLPNEWIISYYNSYPAYGKAGAMASKMYAWYYQKHPKWNYAPYNADVKDNSSDQNFLYSSYSNLGSPYQGYEDTILTFISNRAMVKASNDSIFEVHYHATNGSYHSGTMSASGCLTKAQNGDSYTTILHYYYDKSTYTGTSTNCKLTTY